MSLYDKMQDITQKGVLGGLQKAQVFSNPIANSAGVSGATAAPASPSAAAANSVSSSFVARQPKDKTMLGLINELYPDIEPEMMRAQIEADKKREKRSAIFSAIGDGLTALSNLFFTTKGAPNAFDASKGALAQHKTYWDKVREERDKKRAEYLKAYLGAAGYDAEERQRAWTRENTEKQQAFDNDLKAKAENRAGELHGLQKETIGLQNKGLEYQNAIHKTNADVAPELAGLQVQQAQAGLEHTRAQTNASNASAAASYANADKTKADAKKGEKTYTAQQLTYIYDLARQYGIPTTVNTMSGPKDIAPEIVAGQIRQQLKAYDSPDIAPSKRKEWKDFVDYLGL